MNESTNELFALAACHMAKNK